MTTCAHGPCRHVHVQTQPEGEAREGLLASPGVQRLHSNVLERVTRFMPMTTKGTTSDRHQNATNDKNSATRLQGIHIEVDQVAQALKVAISAVSRVHKQLSLSEPLLPRLRRKDAALHSNGTTGFRNSREWVSQVLEHLEELKGQGLTRADSGEDQLLRATEQLQKLSSDGHDRLLR